MKKLKLYFDASAIGYLDEQSHSNEMSDMLSLWEEIKQGRYSIALSYVTLNEINAIRNTEKLNTLLQHLAEVTYETIAANDEIERVAELVKTTGLLVPDKCENDRLHIGCAIVYGCDILVSYNFNHLANVKTIRGVRGISNLSGYGNIDIMPASMLIGGV